MNFQLPISTAEGVFLAHYSEHGLARLVFPHTESAADSAGKSSAMASVHPLLGEREGVRATNLTQVSHWHQLTTQALNDSLAGRDPRELPPLDLSVGTGFQQRVWKSLLRIATGRTRSYGEVAADIGNLRATRAVGGACGANPIPVLVPCHRVLAANQRIGGFSSGLDWKRKLLALEGITVR